MYFNNDVTLLSREQVFGNQKIDVTEKTDLKCAVSDFAILSGAYVAKWFRVDGDESLRGRTGVWYLSSANDSGDVHVVGEAGRDSAIYADNRFACIRPILPLSNVSLSGIKRRDGFLEVAYGEYPQYAVNSNLGRMLEHSFNTGFLKRTGKTYTTDSKSVDESSEKFASVQHEEFEFNGKRYVRVKSNVCGETQELSNGVKVQSGMYVWVEVSPIKWIVDESAKMLVSKTLLVAGVRFCDLGQYNGNFKSTEMYHYLNTYFIKDMISSNVKQLTQEEKKKELEELKETIVNQVATSTDRDINNYDDLGMNKR